MSPRSTKQPKTRADCLNGPRPCPHLFCFYHIWPHSKADPLPDDSCVLDVAAECGATLDRVGYLLGLTRERIRQIEVIAKTKIRSAKRRLAMLDS